MEKTQKSRTKMFKFRISIKWYKNDNGGDIRTICIDYMDAADKKKQIEKILLDFKTKPMESTGNPIYDKRVGEIPYSVTMNNPDFRPQW